MEHKTKMAKQRIVVMYGGKADEHSISCISAAGVLRALDTDKFEAIEVGITKNGEWIVGGEDPRKWNMSEGLPMVEKTDSSKDVVLDVALGQDGFFAREDDGTLTSLGHVDAVLPVLHGPYGEDSGPVRNDERAIRWLRCARFRRLHGQALYEGIAGCGRYSRGSRHHVGCARL